MTALVKNDTWNVVEILEGNHHIWCKWMSTNKYKLDGTIERFKAHLVAKGFSQKYGID